MSNSGQMPFLVLDFSILKSENHERFLEYYQYAMESLCSDISICIRSIFKRGRRTTINKDRLYNNLVIRLVNGKNNLVLLGDISERTDNRVFSMKEILRNYNFPSNELNYFCTVIISQDGRDWKNWQTEQIDYVPNRNVLNDSVMRNVQTLVIDLYFENYRRNTYKLKDCVPRMD